jgi:hypothetical protein
MRLLHIKVLKQMAHAVTAVERAAHDVIETKAGFSILDHVSKRVRKVDWSGSKFVHGVSSNGGSAFRDRQSGRRHLPIPPPYTGGIRRTLLEVEECATELSVFGLGKLPSRDVGGGRIRSGAFAFGSCDAVTGGLVG